MLYFHIPRFSYAYLYSCRVFFYCLGFFLSVIPSVQAGIYQCVGPAGGIEYRDRPCQSPVEVQQFVPIQYQRTNEKQLKKQDKELDVAYKALVKQHKQQTKVKTKSLKQTKVQKLKTERLQRKCTKLSEKINKIESQLRAGCTINKANRLREQLEVYQTTKEAICAY